MNATKTVLACSFGRWATSQVMARCFMQGQTIFGTRIAVRFITKAFFRRTDRNIIPIASTSSAVCILRLKVSRNTSRIGVKRVRMCCASILMQWGTATAT